MLTPSVYRQYELTTESLADLLLVVIFQSIFVALLKPTKGNVDLCCPPDLGTCQSHLDRGREGGREGGLGRREGVGKKRGAKRVREGMGRGK